jgi:hypothetical protein
MGRGWRNTIIISNHSITPDTQRTKLLHYCIPLFSCLTSERLRDPKYLTFGINIWNLNVDPTCHFMLHVLAVIQLLVSATDIDRRLI